MEKIVTFLQKLAKSNPGRMKFQLTLLQKPSNPNHLLKPKPFTENDDDSCDISEKSPSPVQENQEEKPLLWTIPIKPLHHLQKPQTQLQRLRQHLKQKFPHQSKKQNHL